MDKQELRLKIFDTVHQSIFVIDRNYNIVDANRAACNSMDVVYDRIIGQPCFSVTHGYSEPCWRTGTECPLKLTLETHKQTSVIHKHSHGGQITFEEVVASPLFDDQGNINLIVEELRDVTELVELKEIREHLNSEIKTLRGILPICASCKKIRDDKGYWQQLESYIRDHTEADFSHSYCPQCAEEFRKELRARKNKSQENENH